MRRPALALLLGCLLIVAGASALDGYDYYQTIEYAACDQETYQQDLVIHRTTGTAYNETSGGLEVWHIYVGDHCLEDYGDVRFVNGTGGLAYYLWPDHDSSSARFAVRLEGATSAGAVTIHYGNPSATTTSDGDAVYEFYDGFSAGTIDTIKWYQSKAASIEDGICTVPSGGYLAGKVNYPVGYTTQIVVRYASGANSWAGIESTFGTTQSKDLDMVNQITAYAGSGSSYGGSPHGVNMASEYREVTITRTGGATNRTIILIDGAEKYNTSAYASTANRHPVINAYSGAIYVKSAIVRAYSATPPSVSTFSGEQSPAALQPFPGITAHPRDLAGTGLYTDINGNNRLDYNDLIIFFQHLTWAKTAQPTSCFDFNGNGWLDYNDVITLFSIITEEHP